MPCISYTDVFPLLPGDFWETKKKVFFEKSWTVNLPRVNPQGEHWHAQSASLSLMFFTFHIDVVWSGKGYWHNWLFPNETLIESSRLEKTSKSPESHYWASSPIPIQPACVFTMAIHQRFQDPAAGLGWHTTKRLSTN